MKNTIKHFFLVLSFERFDIVPEQGKYLGSIPNFEPEFKIQFRLENIRVKEEQGENWFGVFEIGNECSTKCSRNLIAGLHLNSKGNRAYFHAVSDGPVYNVSKEIIENNFNLLYWYCMTLMEF